MNALPTPRKTIYSQYVAEQVKQLGNNGGGVWNFTDIAKEMGVSPTHNLRKLLRYHESIGNLWIGYGRVGERSTCYLYHIIENDKLSDGTEAYPF